MKFEKRSFDWLSVEDKEKIWNKTDGKCYYCGIDLEIIGPRWVRERVENEYGGYEHWKFLGNGMKPNTFVIDHIMPRASGGSDDVENLVPCCNWCNSSKGSKNIEEFRFSMALKEIGAQIFTKKHLIWLKENTGFVFPLPFYIFYGEKNKTE